MRDIICRGPVDSPTGYDNVSRGVIRSLYLNGYNIYVVPMSLWCDINVLLPQYFVDMLDNCVNNSHNISVDAPVIHFCLPEQLEFDPRRLNINYTMFEAHPIPDNWVEYSQRADITIVPCEYSREAWIQSGISEKSVKVVPLGVDDRLFCQGVRPLDLYNESGELICDRYQTRILVVGEDIPRKNIRSAIKEFLRVFANDAETCLLLKTSRYSGSDSIVDYIRECKSCLGIKYPDVVLIPQIYPVNLVPQIFALGTHYMSLSHGEGCDLSCMQALFMGIPVMVPRHTGYLQYIDEISDYVIGLPAEPVSASSEGMLKRIYKDRTWYDVSGDAVKDGFQKLMEWSSPDSNEQLSKFRQAFTWDATAAGIMQVVDKFYE